MCRRVSACSDRPVRSSVFGGHELIMCAWVMYDIRMASRRRAHDEMPCLPDCQYRFRVPRIPHQSSAPLGQAQQGRGHVPGDEGSGVFVLEREHSADMAVEIPPAASTVCETGVADGSIRLGRGSRQSVGEKRRESLEEGSVLRRKREDARSGAARRAETGLTRRRRMLRTSRVVNRDYSCALL